jgi:hypothetical protein
LKERYSQQQLKSEHDPKLVARQVRLRGGRTNYRHDHRSAAQIITSGAADNSPGAK